jgi:hypothetical protein
MNCLNQGWREAAGWVYLLICLFDFVLAPTFLGFYGAFTHTPFVIWAPLTTQNGGLFHLSFGAILGVSAWTKGQGEVAEKSAVMQSRKI